MDVLLVAARRSPPRARPKLIGRQNSPLALLGQPLGRPAGRQRLGAHQVVDEAHELGVLLRARLARVCVRGVVGCEGEREGARLWGGTGSFLLACVSSRRRHRPCAASRGRASKQENGWTCRAAAPSLTPRTTSTPSSLAAATTSGVILRAFWAAAGSAIARACGDPVRSAKRRARRGRRSLCASSTPSHTPRARGRRTRERTSGHTQN